MRKTKRRGWKVWLACLLVIAPLLTGTVRAAEQAQTDTQGTEVTPTPEPTLEELRNELLAIMGGGEDTAELQANIDRVIALGDPGGTLRSYLEGMIRLHQLSYEMEQLQASLDAMETADGSLGAIGETVTALEGPNESLSRIGAEVSAQAARLMESAGYDGTGELGLLTDRVLAYLDADLDGTNRTDVAAVLLFQGLLDSGTLNEAGTVTATDAATAHFNNIAGRYRGLASSVRAALKEASQAIADRANRAQALDPGMLVLANGSLSLTDPVFTYDGDVMISLRDAAAFLNGQVVEMTDNATVVIQASGVVLEMTRGSSDAYWNDRLVKMAQPVLCFDQVCYLPLDAMLLCGGMEQTAVGGYALIYTSPDT